MGQGVNTFPTNFFDINTIGLFSSSGTGSITVSSVRTKHGEMTYSYYAVYCWNKLPEDLRAKTTVLELANIEQAGIVGLILALSHFYVQNGKLEESEQQIYQPLLLI